MGVAPDWLGPFRHKKTAIVAGGYLVAVASAMLLLSVRLLPELQVRALESDPAVVEQAIGLVAERQRLQIEWDRLADELARVRPAAGEDSAAPDPASQNGIEAVQPIGLRLDEAAKLLAASDQRYAEFVADSPRRLALINRLDNQQRRAPSGWLPNSYSALVLILAMASGVLGGVISVAKSYVGAAETGPTAAEFFMRPVFGAMLGFVAFLMLNSGQAILTVEASGDPLNPYPIALLGVVSGLLAKDVIASVEGWGRRVFGSLPAAPVEPQHEGQEPLAAERKAKAAALQRIKDGSAAIAAIQPDVRDDQRAAFTVLQEKAEANAATARTQGEAFEAALTRAAAARKEADELSDGAARAASLAVAEEALAAGRHALGALADCAKLADAFVAEADAYRR